LINLPFDPQVITWIISAGGLSGIFILIWRVAVRIEHRITALEGRIKTLEENTLLVGYREYQISASRNMFDVEERLKRYEDDLKKRLQKQEDDTK
jgi:hypothetical protein